ncbi:MAG: hypothetical protein LBJ57_07605 [Prevotellaceae bacterium]|jgi:hypothetical protein|nr:hypothetical protein [Prevotellaceae bacterium]
MKKVAVFVVVLAVSCTKEPYNKFYVENKTHADITIELSCANQRIALKKGERMYVETDEVGCNLSSWNDDKWILYADPAYMYEYFTSYAEGTTKYSFISFVNKIKYEITGSARRVDVTMEWSDGSTRQYSNVSVPATYEFKSWGYDGFVYLSAQNDGVSGSVTCNIYHRDNLFKTATSYGEYSIATASGSIK